MRHTISHLTLVALCIVAAGACILAEGLPGKEVLAGSFSAASWVIAYATDLMGCRTEWYARRGLATPALRRRTWAAPAAAAAGNPWSGVAATRAA